MPTKQQAKPDDSLPYDRETAVLHLSNADSTLARLIQRVGPFDLQLRTMLSPFEALARSIIYQQLHTNAAAAIHNRVKELVSRKTSIKPQDILAVTVEDLRGAGLSRAKATALRDLAAKTLDGTVPTLARLQRMSDEEILERLTAVWGIGRWTVEMLLMSRLGRPDVLPTGDFAVRRGFSLVYGLDEIPPPRRLEEYGERWRPYRSVASWYMWRALDLPAGSLPV